VARANLRLLAAIALAIATEPLRIELSASSQAPGLAGRAYAQVIPDPGFGDPYATGGYGDARPNTSGVVIGTPQIPMNFGPSAPMAPAAVSRPASWPGGTADPARTSAGPPPAAVPYTPGSTASVPPGGLPVGMPIAQQPSAPRKPPSEPPYDSAEIVAHVGSEVIQASEVLLAVNQHLAMIETQHAAELAKLSPDERSQQLNPLRRELMKRAVDDIVKVKLLLAELRRKVPPEALAKHEKIMREHFNAHEIKRLMEEHKATSVPDLEKKLHALGSSLESQRTVFVERQLAGSWLNEHTKDEPQPATHEHLLAYYHQHVAEWDTPARVRWEQLSAKFQNFDSKQEAYQNLARWGNDVLRGAPFAAVAKAHSQEVAAEDGGVHDWTNQGSLRSTVLDQVLFSLPEGALSQILEDEDGFHIVRVLQREVAKRAPFTEVQRDIKKALQDGGKERRQMEYLTKLQQQIPVATIFDEDFVARTSQPSAAVVR
jgi:hypothetical protein